MKNNKLNILNNLALLGITIFWCCIFWVWVNKLPEEPNPYVNKMGFKTEYEIELVRQDMIKIYSRKTGKYYQVAPEDIVLILERENL